MSKKCFNISLWVIGKHVRDVKRHPKGYQTESFSPSLILLDNVLIMCNINNNFGSY